MVYSQKARLSRVGDRLNQQSREPVTILRQGSQAGPTTYAAVQIVKQIEHMPVMIVASVDIYEFGFNANNYRIYNALDPDGTVTTPEVGDIITMGDGTKYRVIPVSENNPPFIWITSNRNRMLVYTEKIQ